MTIATSRLALGTVQFGLPYGVANDRGQPSLEQVADIVKSARARGIDTLDTASAYGESESRLGSIGVAEWRVVTKLPALAAHPGNVEHWVRDAVSASLSRLQVPRLYGLLVHRSQDLLNPEYGSDLATALARVKSQGIVAKLGVSIYDPAELDQLRDRMQLDLVQAPFNVLDRRLHTSGWLQTLKASGIEVHARSAFLQGLLLLPPDRRPEKFRRWQELWDRWDFWLAASSLAPLEACLGFVFTHTEIDRVVVGVETLAQLDEIVDSAVPLTNPPPTSLRATDLRMINPALWSSL